VILVGKETGDRDGELSLKKFVGYFMTVCNRLNASSFIAVKR